MICQLGRCKVALPNHPDSIEPLVAPAHEVLKGDATRTAGRVSACLQHIGTLRQRLWKVRVHEKILLRASEQCRIQEQQLEMI